MKVTIIEDPTIDETEISIVCAVMTDELKNILVNIAAAEITFTGKKGKDTCFVPIKDIFYFETVDGNVFFYTENETYEATTKLYKIEETLKNVRFSRISKTTIVNLEKLMSIRRTEGSRLVATLVNKENLVVSRQYVNQIKKKLGV